jgi:5-methyltetrahydropteroyltriglutamate--homocysteine methyltransferase
MTQLTQNDFYRDEQALAFDLAAAVNEEIRDLFSAGADVVQIDEPYMQAYPEKARKYAIGALNRALEGLEGESTAVHICFGYAALVPGRPPAYAFLTELNACAVRQISIETAQSKLDCSVLAEIPDKKIILGVIDLSTHEVETPTAVAERIRRALGFISPERLIIAPDCGLKYMPRDVAFGKMRAMVEGAGLVRAELIG